jgi:hypothetical protein
VADKVIYPSQTPLVSPWQRMTTTYYEAKDLPVASLDEGGQLMDPGREKLVDQYMKQKYVPQDQSALSGGIDVASGWMGLPWGREAQLQREYKELPLPIQEILRKGSQPTQLAILPSRKAPGLP